MAHTHVPTLQLEGLRMGGLALRIGAPALLVGLAALGTALWLGLGSTDPRMGSHFFHAYLAAYSFYLAITLGALAFVLIQHLTRAGWSVTVRRVAERLALNMFLMVLLLAGFFLTAASEHGREDGLHHLFHWYHHDAVAADPVLQAKEGYLNPVFFAIRMGLYFTVWCGLAWLYAARSGAQDHSGDPKISVFLERAGAPAIILLAFSLTAFIVDWVMSLNPHWFSTIFGVYYFAGAMLSALSLIVLLLLMLQRFGLLKDAVTHEHYHDLGKLMFAFTFFWGYIAFSQYMLIWYANMPEETQFFIPRQWGPWAGISLTLLIVHLLIPFPGLLSRNAKRRPTVLAFWAVWSLCACALDMLWLVLPNQFIQKVPAIAARISGESPHMPPPNAMTWVADRFDLYRVTDPELAQRVSFPLEPGPLAVTVLCFAGLGGLYVFATMLGLRGRPLAPLRDPRLNEALGFENV